MGIIKNAKQDMVGNEARTAWEAGRAVFTPLLNVPRSASGLSGGIDDLAVMTEAILAVGWRLDTWAAVTDSSGRPQIMPLFVRPGAQVR